jgi:anti-sigma factor RsiW
MDCELARERIVTAAYNELSDEQAHELDRHIAGCQECALEREHVLALKTLLNVNPALEPSPNLVARARLRLEEALDALPPKRWYERWSQQVVNNFARLQSAPVAAALLLVAGAGAGCLGEYEYAQSRAAHAAAQPTLALLAPQFQVSQSQDQQFQTQQLQAQQPESAPQFANVASISGIVRHPNSEIVDVTYNQLVPRQIEGSLDDPGIRQLLMLASENSASPGIRDDSVGLLAAECRAGHSCQPSGIRDALMVALRYDKSPAVRQKALEGLEPYVAEDVRVRDAVLEALLNDNDARVRSAAIGLLEPVEADSSVRQVLYSVSNTDDNPQIRNASRQILSRVPEFQ